MKTTRRLPATLAALLAFAAAPAAAQPPPTSDGGALPSRPIDAGLEGAWQKAVAIWEHRITTVDGQEITVEKIVFALVLLVVGYLVSRRLSALFDQRILTRFVDRAAAAVLRTLTFYALLAFFAFFALDLVGIPVTVFTFLGGVLAIGVGFGSQNVVNNFISGLILMFERPIKVGDLVDVDGTQGMVERIGARSTRVRSGDNTHIIIPNSSFLEKNVLNWTVSDDRIRAHVDVGVAYGSPTEKVAELLLQAATASSRTLPEPVPEVLFLDFAADALLFRVYFWLRAQAPLDRLRAESEVRFAVDRLFGAADVVIAFPQRDVHLDAARPIAVHLVDGAAAPAAPPSPAGAQG